MTNEAFSIILVQLSYVNAKVCVIIFFYLRWIICRKKSEIVSSPQYNNNITIFLSIINFCYHFYHSYCCYPKLHDIFSEMENNKQLCSRVVVVGSPRGVCSPSPTSGRKYNFIGKNIFELEKKNTESKFSLRRSVLQKRFFTKERK